MTNPTLLELARLDLERTELRAEIERLRSVVTEDSNQIIEWKRAHAELCAEVMKLKHALRAAIATWCPRDPGGDGADGDTYRLVMSAIGEDAP